MNCLRVIPVSQLSETVMRRQQAQLSGLWQRTVASGFWVRVASPPPHPTSPPPAEGRAIIVLAKSWLG